MIKMVEKSNGYYILEVKVGAVTITKAFMNADKSLEEIAKADRQPDGFLLDIPDKEMK